MTFYEHLIAETAAEHDAFQNTPIIRRAVTEGIPRDIYVAYLTQAYHHVKWTCPLLALAAAIVVRRTTPFTPTSTNISKKRRVTRSGS